MGVTLVARRVRSGDAARWVEEIRSSVFTALPSEQHPAFLLATPEAFFFWRAGPSELGLFGESRAAFEVMPHDRAEAAG